MLRAALFSRQTYDVVPFGLGWDLDIGPSVTEKTHFVCSDITYTKDKNRMELVPLEQENKRSVDTVGKKRKKTDSGRGNQPVLPKVGSETQQSR